jgi:putative FmdB family regulatory protein
MPTYDYECTECGVVMEIKHSIKDDAIEHRGHPRCGGGAGACSIAVENCNGKLKRLISKVMFNFKGGAPTPKFGG